jgi:recombination protein RecT
MAKVKEIGKAINGNSLVKQETLMSLLERDDIKKRFEGVLKNKSAGFVASILSLVNATPQLKACEPRSVLASAMVAATLDLPINQNLGFAFIIPYGSKAQFQIGWKALVQLAIRTNKYRSMNAAPVYEGELKSYNRITGEIEFDLDAKKSNKVIGFVAFFRLINGFEKYFYMTLEEVTAHGKRYSKSFATGNWATNFEPMALKTVIKLLLSKWGILSIEMQTAMEADQAIVNARGEGFEFDYKDAPPEPAVEATPVEVVNPALDLDDGKDAIEPA